MNRKPLLLLSFVVASFGLVYYSHLNTGVRAYPMAETLVLYNANSGTVPQPPNMTFASFPMVTPVYQDSATVLDTTSTNSISAGWTSSAPNTPNFPLLVRSDGFQVDFTVHVETEAHANNNRAGFSVILLSDDAKGVELAFWENEIWAQHDNTTGALFTHGEGIAYPTTTSLVDYQIYIHAETYTLTANTVLILTGPVRDYSDFNGFPDPYETPNFLFLGDDTTSASARIKLTYVSVSGTDPLSLTPTSTLPTATLTESASSSPTPVTPSPTQTATPMPSPTSTEGFVTPTPTGITATGQPPTPTPTSIPEQLKIFLPIILRPDIVEFNYRK